MADLERVSITIDRGLLARLEGLLRRAGYQNRSEFLRDVIRERIVSEEWSADEETLATITIVYDHHQRGLAERLIDLQHHHARVLAATHVHLDEHLCAEMIMVRGRATEIRELADHIRREKGVLHGALSMSSTGKSLE